MGFYKEKKYKEKKQTILKKRPKQGAQPGLKTKPGTELDRGSEWEEVRGARTAKCSNKQNSPALWK